MIGGGHTLPWGASTSTEAYNKGMLLETLAKPHPSPAPLPAQPEHEDVLNRTLAA